MIRRRLSVVVAAAALLLAPTAAQAAAPAGPRGPTFGVSKVGPQDGGGEPSIASADTGELYVTYPASSGTPFFRSKNRGRSWTKGATADNASGDDCITTDRSGALYLCNLAGNNDKAPLQADVYKSTNDGTSWAQGSGVLSGAGASSQPFAVDRPWGDAYVPKGATTGRALAVLMYHDFVPSQIWVNVSTDGGRTFGAPTDVIAGSPEAQAYTFCNSVPAGTRIEKSGPHPGRIYAAWIAADAAQTLNLRAAHPTWSVSRVTPKAVHVGDICNLGIFCVDPSSNRDLLDFISVAVDPMTGLMHIAYTNDNGTHEIDAANQVGGPSVLAR